MQIFAGVFERSSRWFRQAALSPPWVVVRLRALSPRELRVVAVRSKTERRAPRSPRSDWSNEG